MRSNYVLPPGINPGSDELFMLESLLVGDGQLLSPFFTTGSQYSTTVRRGHSFSETVLILSLSLRRLIRSFHDL